MGLAHPDPSFSEKASASALDPFVVGAFSGKPEGEGMTSQYGDRIQGASSGDGNRVGAEVQALQRREDDGYRIVSEFGTHFATVSTAEEAATAREFYAAKYQCIATVQRTSEKPQRW
jgi:hypothetical protein